MNRHHSLELLAEANRRGWVFRPLDKLGAPHQRNRLVIGPVVSAIGKSAGVIVNEKKRGDEVVRKYASAHDLRRSFGNRWAKRVMPAVLRKLMRHATVQTSMTFYVDLDAQDLAAEIAKAMLGNSLGNSEQRSDREEKYEERSTL